MPEIVMFEECLAEVREAIASFDAAPGYDPAERLCQMTRVAWSAYLTQYLVEPERCSEELQQDFSSALAAARTRVERASECGALDDIERQRLPGFEQAIGLRQTLVETLHGPDGKRAVLAILERHANQ